MTNSKFFWIAVGIILAMFVIPYVTGMVSGMRNKSN